MYFLTQGNEETRKKSDRWCVDAASKKKFDEEDPKKPFIKNETIPLWNVKRIETNVADDNGIVDMSFTMRYTNITDPDGYYKYKDDAET